MVNDIANSTNSDYLTNKSELIVNVPNSQGLKHNKTLNMKNKDQNNNKMFYSSTYNKSKEHENGVIQFNAKNETNKNNKENAENNKDNKEIANNINSLNNTNNIELSSNSSNYNQKLKELYDYFDIYNLTLLNMINKTKTNDLCEIIESDEYINLEKTKLITLFHNYEFILNLNKNSDLMITEGDIINNFIYHNVSIINIDKNPSIQIKLLCILILYILGIFGKALTIVSINYFN